MTAWIAQSYGPANTARFAELRCYDKRQILNMVLFRFRKQKNTRQQLFTTAEPSLPPAKQSFACAWQRLRG